MLHSVNAVERAYPRKQGKLLTVQGRNPQCDIFHRAESPHFTLTNNGIRNMAAKSLRVP
jgi:hypothetical protein